MNTIKPLNTFKSVVSIGAIGAALMLGAVTSAQAGDLSVTNARLSLLPGNTPGAGYFELHNDGDEMVTLVGADSEAFDSIELHMSMEKDGMSHMHALESVDVAPDESVEFAPKARHLMMMERQTSLSEGDEVDVTLHFADDTDLPVTFSVVAPGAM